MIGITLSRYTILHASGQGGTGGLYPAEDTRLKREVALKVLPASLRNDPARLSRFRREAESVASLDHPYIPYISIEEAVPEEGTGDEQGAVGRTGALLQTPFERHHP